MKRVIWLAVGFYLITSGFAYAEQSRLDLEPVAHCVRADSGDSPEVLISRVLSDKGKAAIGLANPNNSASLPWISIGDSFENDHTLSVHGVLSASVSTQGEGRDYDLSSSLTLQTNNADLKDWLKNNTNLIDNNLNPISLKCMTVEVKSGIGLVKRNGENELVIDVLGKDESYGLDLSQISNRTIIEGAYYNFRGAVIGTKLIMAVFYQDKSE